uniref:Uncharacterized protein n=1 Tax=Panagrellus redivivus TaxID=6233 RepID=A0A7E4ULC3_PANRE
MLIRAVFLVGLIRFCTGVTTPCADQTQQCGVLIEEFEKQIQDYKTAAFRRCFNHPACQHEKIAFDDCYTRAIRAVRAPFNHEQTPNDGFFDSSERYRAQVEQCLGGVTRNGGQQPDDDIFAEIVFSTQLSDEMWKLAETPEGFRQGCSRRDYGRIFGDGISRILDTSKTSINNLNTSCTLQQSEMNCYRKSLDNDSRFQELLKHRDDTLIGCVQRIRLQSQCRGGGNPDVTTCLCAAREEFNNRLQASLLECARKSDIGKLYESLLEKGIRQEVLRFDDSDYDKGVDNDVSDAPPTPAVEPKHRQQNTGRHRYHQATTTTHVPSPPEFPVTNVITPGSLINGQCLCACPTSTTLSPQGSTMASVVEQQVRDAMSTSMDSRSATSGGYVVSPSTDQFVVQHRPPASSIAQPVQPAQAMAYGNGGGYYPSYQSQPRARAVADPFTAMEMGVSDGFSRFFNGLPPPVA